MEFIDIKSITVDTAVDTALMVYSASILKTKTDKPYLLAELGNKTGRIAATWWKLPPNYKAPAEGTVLHVAGTITAYNGNKQLNITNAVVYGDPYREEDFAIEVSNRIAAAEFNSIISGIREELQMHDAPLLLAIFDDILETYGANMLTATAAVGIHHAGIGGWAKHTSEVVYYAQAIYSTLPAAIQSKVRKELLLLGAFLHDIGKLNTYKFESGVPTHTETGKFIEHIVEGVAIVREAMHRVLNDIRWVNESTISLGMQIRAVKALEHIIAAHHTELEWGSPVNPVLLEAVIVCHADQLSASLDTINDAIDASTEPWTAKIYTEHNRAFTTSRGDV